MILILNSLSLEVLDITLNLSYIYSSENIFFVKIVKFVSCKIQQNDHFLLKYHHLRCRLKMAPIRDHTDISLSHMSYLKAVWTLPTYLRRSIIGHNVNKSFALSLSLTHTLFLFFSLSHCTHTSHAPSLTRLSVYIPPPITTVALFSAIHYSTRRSSHPVFTINYIILIVSLATWRSCFESVHARRLTLPRTPYTILFSITPV